MGRRASSCSLAASCEVVRSHGATKTVQENGQVRIFCLSKNSVPEQNFLRYNPGVMTRFRPRKGEMLYFKNIFTCLTALLA